MEQPSPPKMSPAVKRIVRRVEESAQNNSLKVALKSKAAFRIGSVVGITVISIYAYTMFAVKQETFLDDSIVPLKPIRITSNQPTSA